MSAVAAEDHAPVWLLGLDSRLQLALFVEATQGSKLGVFGSVRARAPLCTPLRIWRTGAKRHASYLRRMRKSSYGALTHSLCS